MIETITVSGACQTGGLAAALQEIFPKTRINATQITALNSKEEIEQFVDSFLRGSQCWVTMDTLGLETTHSDLLANSGLRVITHPFIDFASFHPDLAYAYDASTGKYTRWHYNSAICVWCYANSIDPADVTKLFSRDVFEELGYFSRWDLDVQYLEARFTAYGMDFPSFFLNIKRKGLFMHSANHPKAFVLARLAQMIALKIGADHGILGKSIEIDDGLKDFVWPLYPEIGDYYALEGGYQWRCENQVFEGVDEYVDFAYRSYAEQEIQPRNIRILGRDLDAYNAMLAPRLGVQGVSA